MQKPFTAYMYIHVHVCTCNYVRTVKIRWVLHYSRCASFGTCLGWTSEWKKQHVLFSQAALSLVSCSITYINLTVAKHVEKETELKTAQRLEIKMSIRLNCRLIV